MGVCIRNGRLNATLARRVFMSNIYSYVVRYDSGFAPNPFYGYCTLATCKPKIRKSAQIGDWIVGSGSADAKVKLGGRLVYAMKITEALSIPSYYTDPRFSKKIPYRFGSRMQSCGDNIYYPIEDDPYWGQKDSFHSNVDGTPNIDHINKDTGPCRILVSDKFVYFGGFGPEIPSSLRNSDGEHVCKKGIGEKKHTCQDLLAKFEAWINDVGLDGYQGAPFEWRQMRGEY